MSVVADKNKNYCRKIKKDDKRSICKVKTVQVKTTSEKKGLEKTKEEGIKNKKNKAKIILLSHFGRPKGQKQK